MPPVALSLVTGQLTVTGRYHWLLLRTLCFDVVQAEGGVEMRSLPSTQDRDQGKRGVQQYLPALAKV